MAKIIEKDGWEFTTGEIVFAKLVNFAIVNARPISDGSCLGCGGRVFVEVLTLLTPGGREFKSRSRSSCRCEKNIPGLSFSGSRAEELFASYS